MKKTLYVLTSLVVLAGLFTSCEKPNKTEEENNGSTTENYTEKAFGINMEFVYVEGGQFEMGATAEQGEDAWDDEKPVRWVVLDSYHIGKYEVTQKQWKAVMGTTLDEQREKSDYDEGSKGVGDDYPIYYVNWEDAQEFCQKLSKATGKKYVLPTEAQWEYAARGGNRNQHYKYSGSNNIDKVAWYSDNSGSRIHPVGKKSPNSLEIYDMSGNVAEWCSDWYGDYDKNDTDNPQGPEGDSERVGRGGDWSNDARYCRVSHRADYTFVNRYSICGFRVAVLP